MTPTAVKRTKMLPTKTSKARVFFVGRSDRFQTNAAEEFGERTFLRITTNPLETADFMREVVAELERERFNPDEDFVAMTGPALDLALFVGTIFGLWGDMNLKILVFEARRDRYRLHEITAEAL